jgi:lipoate---protein ligase
MKIYISDTDNPYYNLALEEWAVKNYDATDEDLMILYVNRPSVVVGRNQNLFEEVNLKYCKDNNIQVCRRVSGGGTVFHDKGNLNWCVVTAYDSKKVNKYEYFARHLIDFLKTLGIEAYLNERNGIEVNGLKISGQAQFASRKNILSHGTLLINSNLQFMQPAIEPDARLKIQSKASPSVRSSVTNISSLDHRFSDCRQFINSWIAFAEGKIVNAETLSFSLDELIEKYRSDTWIKEKSPAFKIQIQSIHGEFTAHVEKGRVVECSGNLPAHFDAINQDVETFIKLTSG